jgi:hypothetical protein
MAAVRDRLDQGVKDDMIASYQSGERVAGIAERHGVPRSTLYAVLRSAGIDPVRAPRSIPLARGHFCRACGAPKRIMPSGHRSGSWFSSPTCGDPACVAMVMYVGSKGKRHGVRYRSRALRPVYTDLDYDEVLGYDLDLDCEDVLERDFEVFVDERGLDLSSATREFPWGTLSTVSIAVRAVSAEPSEIGMRLRCPTTEAFVERFCGGDPSVLGPFDLIYAWRCSCPEQTVLVARTLAELPDAVGFYGACPRCGAVAIEVFA